MKGITEEPYADITVDGDGDYMVQWGFGWRVYGTAYRRSLRAARRIRDRKFRKMEKRTERIRLAKEALDKA